MMLTRFRFCLLRVHVGAGERIRDFALDASVRRRRSHGVSGFGNV